MIAFEAVLREVRGLKAVELERWIEARWVRAERGQGGYVFHEIDVARLHLIVELRHEFLIDEEAMPVVLHLLDQVHALRRQLKSVVKAVENLPPETQALLRDRLRD